MTLRDDRREELPEWSRNVLSKHGTPGTSRLSLGIVTYGSLIHPAEVRNLFGLSEDEHIRVKVRGYRRRFNKRIAEHIYRETEPEKTAVLNLERNEGEWFNGLLLGPVERSDFRQYAFREQEYELEKISPLDLEFYHSAADIPSGVDAIYTCLLNDESKLSSSIEPVPSYLDLCLSGASHHGSDFKRDFKRTTLVRENSLRRYLDEDR